MNWISLKPVLLSAFMCAVALSLSSCESEEKVQPGVTNALLTASEQPTQITYNVTIRFSSSGNTRAVLKAGRVQVFSRQNYTFLDSNVRVDFYNRDGKHSSTLTSRTARINDLTKNMTAYDSVHITSDIGTIVDTDSLEWNNKDQILHSESFVRIQEKNGRVTTGHGFQSDQNLTNYQILRPTIVAPPEVLQNPNMTNASRPNSPSPIIPSPSGNSTPFGIPELNKPATSGTKLNDSTKK